MSIPIDRKAEVVRRCIRRELSVTKAAGILGVSRRQVGRWKNSYLEEGIAGLRSRKIGRPAVNRTPSDIRTKAVSLLGTVYADFGPTLASEKLAERDGIILSPETVRQIMISEGIWTDQASKPLPIIHQLREPMERRGELIQIDGSEHRWFEGRGPKCTLLLFIDDATSEIGHLQFAESESSLAYMEALQAYIEKHGRPLALYSDKHSIFRNNRTNPDRNDRRTQFAAVLDRLDIGILNASSSQAKGRVERGFRTLQDRLVKEMRLRDISSIEAANAFCDQYARMHNESFARAAFDPTDAHRPLPADLDLFQSIRWEEERTLTKSLVVHYNKAIFIVEDCSQAREAIGQKVVVSEHPNGTIELQFKGVTLPYRFMDKMRRIHQPEIADSKRLGHALQFAQVMQQTKPHHSQRNLGAPKNSKSPLFQEPEQLDPNSKNSKGHDREMRKVSPQRSFSYAGRRFVLVESVISNSAIGEKVAVEDRENGEIRVWFRGLELPISHASRPKRQARGPLSQDDMKRLLSNLPSLRD